MKYALIGCGRIATNHVKAVVNNKLEFAAVCDVVPEQMEALLAKHGLEKDSSIARYTDYKKMIEEKGYNTITMMIVVNNERICKLEKGNQLDKPLIKVQYK